MPWLSGGVVRTPTSKAFKRVRGVAGGGFQQMGFGFRRQIDLVVAQPIFSVFKRMVQDDSQMVFFQGPQFADPRTGKQGRVQGEKRVLSSGADQNDGSLFQMGKKGILLAFIEMVDFIQKEDSGLLVEFLVFGGLVENLAQVGQARGDGV